VERHPLSERFHELLALCGELHDKKQSDYGRADDPFANIKASEDFGMPAWVGAILRANDKMRRLQKAAQQVVSGEGVSMENEAIEDSFFDLAVYALIAQVLFEESQKRYVVQTTSSDVFEAPLGVSATIGRAIANYSASRFALPYEIVHNDSRLDAVDRMFGIRVRAEPLVSPGKIYLIDDPPGHIGEEYSLDD
jgi:hypothetical protein